MFRIIRRFFTNLKKVLKFVPVIWNAPDWDWTGLLEILQFKLKQMRVCLENGHHKYGYKDAKRIKTCELLISRLLENNYCEYKHNEHSLKWGKLEMVLAPREPNARVVSAIFDRKYARSDQEKKLEKEEFKKIYEHEEYMQKQDICYLFDTIKKYLTGWWD